MDSELPNNIDAVRAAVAAGAHFDYLFFWGHRQRSKGRPDASCLSQWFPAGLEVDGVRYPTAEHWMMAEKARLFGDKAVRQKVLAAETPGAAQALGRRVAGFSESEWATKRYGVVVAGNRAKFRQNPKLLSFLLGTGTRVLAEAAPLDLVWGIGLSESAPDARNPAGWPGLNLLGFALMEIRAELSKERSNSGDHLGDHGF